MVIRNSLSYPKSTRLVVWRWFYLFALLLHNEEPGDMRNVTEKGKIPAPDSTFRFLNVAYPCLNEKQLAIGETTTVGKRELRNEEGMFYIE